MIRNVGIISHIDAGKTTTTEAILYLTGVIPRRGTVDEGTTTTDFDEIERERGITIQSASVQCDWKNRHINIIDTPGHVDFTAEVERSLRVLDGALMIVCAVGGVEPQTETVWRQARRYRIPCVAFINKMDRVGADFHKAVNGLRTRLGAVPLPLMIPLGVAQDFRGAIDLWELERVLWTPDTSDEERSPLMQEDEMYLPAIEARESMLETLAEHDDLFAEAYLEEKDIPKKDFEAAVRRACLTCRVVPVLCGSALTLRGVNRVLDAISYYLPAPSECPSIVGIHPKTHQREERPPDPNGPIAMLAFKTVFTGYGKMTYLRVYSGVVKKGQRLINSTTGKMENIGPIYLAQGKKRVQTDTAGPGSIILLEGLNATTGHTLCDRNHPILLDAIPFPKPLVRASVEPRRASEMDELMAALGHLAEDDPTFTVSTDAETGQIIVSAMGELHLNIIGRRLNENLHVHARIGNPTVVYRESIQNEAEGVGRFSQEIDEKMHEAVARVRVVPGKPGSDVIVSTDLTNERKISPTAIQAAQEGVMEAAQTGVFGFPLSEAEVTLIDLEFPGDRSDLAAKVAASHAVENACRNAGIRLLEPVMDVEIVTDPETVGPMLSDLNAHRAQISGMEMEGDLQKIRARIPLAETFGDFTTRLRNLTQGRAAFTMQPAGFAPVSPEQTKRILGL
ncbi:MAG TPA: elongation factor G [bacterium]|nr:elongation factor G [bacterium]HQL62068.1 elongation factor G [bacterium]